MAERQRQSSNPGHISGIDVLCVTYAIAGLESCWEYLMFDCVKENKGLL